MPKWSLWGLQSCGFRACVRGIRTEIEPLQGPNLGFRVWGFRGLGVGFRGFKGFRGLKGFRGFRGLGVGV